MGLTSAVHWWEESQMRVLVLTSLVIQFILLIFTFLRSMSIPRWSRFIMWLAYLGGDAIAIYALATLFNRHKDQDRGGKGVLEVAWAPVLLIHLGGHDGITAYNIEDNELWTRHLLNVVSQVTVAIYVFCKSWPPGGDKRLLQASILLFVPGVLKCFAKPWALKRASINSLVSSSDSKRTAKKGEAERDPNSLEKYVEQAKAFVQEQKNKGNEAQSERARVENGVHPPPQQGAKLNKDEMDPFEEHVKPAGDDGERAPVEEDTIKPIGSRRLTIKQRIERMLGGLARRTAKQNKDEMDPFEEQAKRERGLLVREQKDEVGVLRGEVCELFVDLSSPYIGRRLSIFKFFWVLSQTTTRKSKEEEEDKAETVYRYVQRGLVSAFFLLYTKLKTAGIPGDIHLNIGSHCLRCIHASRITLPWAAIGLFHHSHREAYNDIDVKITYALLCCTAVLEGYSSLPIISAEMDTSGSDDLSNEKWPEMVAQYSLIGYFARNKNHSKKMMILSKFGCKDLVDQHWCMRSCFSSRGITELVLGYLRDGWEKKIQDPVSYRRFNDNRGQRALEGYEDKLGRSIKRPFDESVLLWHIATDFCFFLMRTPPHEAVQCREMSNYMVYLLFVNPEMLLPGTRRNLFTTAYNDLNRIIGDIQLSCSHLVEEGKLMQPLLRRLREPIEGQLINGDSNFIHDAWDLAQGLLKLKKDHGDEKMWEVIQGVWVEMLCFSASRCRGYLHAKALGSGGEFLSYIWLLLFYMGMETFAERLQREELPNREANNNGVPWPSDAHNGNGTTSSTSQLHISVSPSSENHIIGEELV